MRPAGLAGEQGGDVSHYHLKMNVAVKEEGGKLAASAHYAYICRQGLFAKLKSDEELVLTRSGNMPAFATHDPSVFWLASDEYERSKGTTYRELEGALPRELTFEQQQAIVQKFIDRVLVTHPYSWAIHIKEASDGGDQPHVHLMWSERILDDIERGPELFFKRAAATRKRKDGTRGDVDPATGGCKKDSMHPRLEEFRALWAELVNEAYAAAGMDLHVDHRSYADQGIDKIAERHLGPVRTKELQAARAEVAEAEREAELLVAAVEAREVVGSVLVSTLKRRNPPPSPPRMPPTFDEPPLRKPAAPVPGERKLVPVVRPEDRLAPEPMRPPQMPRLRPAELEDHRFDAFIARLTTPVPRQAPRKPGERRQRPRLYQSAPPPPSRWREYRLRILIRAYGTGSPLLADAWYIERHDFGIVMTRLDGSRILDKGSRIEAEHGNEAEVKAMVELAKMKGWSEVTVYGGGDDFKRRAMAESLRAGVKINVDNEHDKRLLQEVKQKMVGPGPP